MHMALRVTSHAGMNLGLLQHSSESNGLAGVRTNLTKPHKPHICRTGRHFCADCMVCAVLCGLCVRAVIITSFIYYRLTVCAFCVILCVFLWFVRFVWGHTNHTKTHRTHKYNGRFLLRRVLRIQVTQHNKALLLLQKVLDLARKMATRYN